MKHIILKRKRGMAVMFLSLMLATMGIQHLNAATPEAASSDAANQAMKSFLEDFKSPHNNNSLNHFVESFIQLLQNNKEHFKAIMHPTIPNKDEVINKLVADLRDIMSKLKSVTPKLRMAIIGFKLKPYQNKLQEKYKEFSPYITKYGKELYDMLEKRMAAITA